MSQGLTLMVFIILTYFSNPLSFFYLNIFQDEKGSDSIAVQLADEKHWDELVIIIAVVCTFSSIGSFLIQNLQSEKSNGGDQLAYKICDIGMNLLSYCCKNTGLTSLGSLLVRIILLRCEKLSFLVENHYGEGVFFFSIFYFFLSIFITLF